MELFAFLILAYAIKSAVEDARAALRKSRTDAAGGKSPPSRFRHDAGFHANQLAGGFPEARHGFARGWHEASKAHAEAMAGRQKARTEQLEHHVGLLPQLADYRTRQQKALEQIRGGQAGTEGGAFAPVLLTARSKSGKPVNRLTGAPEDTAMVHDKDDLDRRLAAAADDPDMEVTTRPMPGTQPASTDTTVVTENGEPVHSPKTPPSTASPTEGNTMPTGTGEVTYDGVQRNMTATQDAAEQQAAEADAAAKAAGDTAEQMQALEMDPATLGAMADHLDAHEAVRAAVARMRETAETVQTTLARGHSGLAEAHQNAPVEAAAKPFYQEG